MDTKKTMTMKIKAYLSAPCSGYDDERDRLFASAEERLLQLGVDEVVNPRKNGLPKDALWVEHMRRDLMMLLDGCNVVIRLSGDMSLGCHIELALARWLEIPWLMYGDVSWNEALADRRRSFREWLEWRIS